MDWFEFLTVKICKINDFQGLFFKIPVVLFSKNVSFVFKTDMNNSLL